MDHRPYPPAAPRSRRRRPPVPSAGSPVPHRTPPARHPVAAAPPLRRPRSNLGAGQPSGPSRGGQPIAGSPAPVGPPSTSASLLLDRELLDGQIGLRDLDDGVAGIVLLQAAMFERIEDSGKQHPFVEHKIAMPHLVRD